MMPYIPFGLYSAAPPYHSTADRYSWKRCKHPLANKGKTAKAVQKRRKARKARKGSK